LKWSFYLSKRMDRSKSAECALIEGIAGRDVEASERERSGNERQIIGFLLEVWPIDSFHHTGSAHPLTVTRSKVA
jgi:hypothetical protein